MCKKALAALISEYVQAKEAVKALEPQIKLGNEIKKQLLEKNLDNYENDRVIIKLSKIENTEIDVKEAEKILKETLSPSQFKRIVSYEPVINQQALSDMVYEGQIPANLLKDTLIEKAPTIRLTYKLKKGG